MPPSRAELRATRRARRAERVSVRDAGAREAADPAARRARSGAQDLDPAQLDAARMVAIEMAASGRTREQVDAHLRDAFHIGTTQPVLDDVFGAQGSRRRRSPFAGG